VINLSLGGYTHDNIAPIAIGQALDKLNPATVVVAAAGNRSDVRPEWPASFKRVIAVAALDEEGRRAEFSNYGEWIDMCAPGSNIVSIFPPFQGSGCHWPQKDIFDAGAAVWSGTSFAAPKVAGAIAALMTYRGISAGEAAYHLRNSGAIRLRDLGVVLNLEALIP
jgi:subtilisin family serine protease